MTVPPSPTNTLLNCGPPNPFQTSDHCYRFARRMATALDMPVHVLRTPGSEAPRRVVNEQQLQMLTKQGKLYVIESSAVPDDLDERPEGIG